jgi:O-glycosyl hydrolase
MKKKSIVTLTVLLLALTLAFIYAGCEMDVAETMARVVLVEPYITQHPASQTLTAGSTAPVTLTVESDGWESGDGTLSYQWYTFTTVTAYLNDGGTEISGETGPSYTPTPAALTTTAGAKNYFYVVVTNTNGGVTSGKTSDLIQSDVAVISFYAGATPPPVITRQPGSADARFGRSMNPLSLRATSGVTGEELSYQWYRVTLDANGKATADADGFPVSEAIAGETGIEYQPNPGEMRMGKNYFYVEVTNTTTMQKEYSVPATINILPGLRAVDPVIKVQPKAALYFTGDTPAALIVEGESTDFGTISYQWYRHPSTTNSNKNGTEISGATGASYTPDLTAYPNAFYYAEVINTNDQVEGATTAVTASRAVNVRTTTAVANAGEGTQNSVIQIGDPADPDNRFNYIRGYGGMDVAWSNFPETFPADTELMYDPDRLGFNMLRIMLPVSKVNIDVAMDDLVNVTKRRPHYYDNVKIVNKYGGYVAAAPWTPPKEWKSNNSINGGGILRHEYYKLYAAYLKSFAQHMYNRGAPIYCISIQNEPNYTAAYDGCEWTPTEMMNFFKEVGVFTEGVRGWGGGKQTSRVLTMNGESANNVNINYPAIDDPDAYNAIDVFSRHVYGERRTNMWSGGNSTNGWVLHRSHVQQVDGKEVWMMEHNINSANAAGYVLDSKWDYIWRFMNDIDLVMRLNNENAFVWWASKRFYSMIGDGQYGTPAGVALPRGWGMSHYSKYTIDMTRIGFTMTGSAVSGEEINFTEDRDDNPVVNGWGLGKNLDMDNTTARITAYVSRDGSEISMVMWTPSLTGGESGFDMGVIRIDMPTGFTIGSATAVRSYLGPPPTPNAEPEPVFHEPFDVGVSQNRNSAYITLPRSQIVSVKFTIGQIYQGVDG